MKLLITPSIILAILAILTPTAKSAEVGSIVFTVSPRSTVVEREGITGAGQMVSAGGRTLIFYPNHPDDFGGSGGMGSGISEDGGATWKAQPE